MQRTEFINLILLQLWPYLDKYLRNTLIKIENDEVLRERLHGYQVKSIRFPTVDLGKVPPRIHGIKFHQASGRDEAILDLTIVYAGDLSIMVEAALINEHFPAVRASLYNLNLTSSHVRILLRPLIPDVPFVGSVTVSFLETPHLDFDLGGFANVFDVPGISLLLRHIIQDQLEQTIVLPNSQTFELIPKSQLDEIKRKQKEKRGIDAVFMPKGVLFVNIIEAKGLYFFILSTSIYDLVLLHVCHFHHHHLIVVQLSLSRYSCLYLGSLHPKIL